MPFGSIDLTPTIEEYTLNVPGTCPDKPFLHERWVQEKTRHSDGHTRYELDPYIKEKGERLLSSYEFLQTFVEQHPDDDAGMQIMALSIYWLVLLPKSFGYVKVVDLFSQVMHGTHQQYRRRPFGL